MSSYDVISLEVINAHTGECCVVGADTADDFVAQVSAATGIAEADCVLLWQRPPTVGSGGSGSGSGNGSGPPPSAAITHPNNKQPLPLATAARIEADQPASQWALFDFQEARSSSSNAAVAHTETTATGQHAGSVLSLSSHRCSTSPGVGIVICYDRSRFGRLVGARVPPLQPDPASPVPLPHRTPRPLSPAAHHSSSFAALITSCAGGEQQTKAKQLLQTLAASDAEARRVSECVSLVADACRERLQSLQLAYAQLGRQQLAIQASSVYTTDRAAPVLSGVCEQLPALHKSVRAAAKWSSLTPGLLEESKHVTLQPGHATPECTTLHQLLPAELLLRWAQRCGAEASAAESQVQQLLQHRDSITSGLQRLAGTGQHAGQLLSADQIFAAKACVDDVHRLVQQQDEVAVSAEAACSRVISRYQQLQHSTTSGGTGADAITTLTSACLISTAEIDRAVAQLAGMEARDAQVRNVQQRMHALLSAAAAALDSHLNEIAQIQAATQRAEDLLGHLRPVCARLDTQTAQLCRLRGLPAAYSALCTETARRQAFKELYTRTAQHAMHNLHQLRAEEMRARERFDAKLAAYLPSPLLVGMRDRPPLLHLRPGPATAPTPAAAEEQLDLCPSFTFDAQLPPMPAVPAAASMPLTRSDTAAVTADTAHIAHTADAGGGGNGAPPVLRIRRPAGEVGGAAPLTPASAPPHLALQRRERTVSGTSTSSPTAVTPPPGPPAPTTATGGAGANDGMHSKSALRRRRCQTVGGVRVAFALEPPEQLAPGAAAVRLRSDSERTEYTTPVQSDAADAPPLSSSRLRALQRATEEAELSASALRHENAALRAQLAALCAEAKLPRALLSSAASAALAAEMPGIGAAAAAVQGGDSSGGSGGGGASVAGNWLRPVQQLFSSRRAANESEPRPLTLSAEECGQLLQACKRAELAMLAVGSEGSEGSEGSDEARPRPSHATYSVLTGTALAEAASGAAQKAAGAAVIRAAVQSGSGAGEGDAAAAARTGVAAAAAATAATGHHSLVSKLHAAVSQLSAYVAHSASASAACQLHLRALLHYCSCHALSCHHLSVGCNALFFPTPASSGGLLYVAFDGHTSAARQAAGGRTARERRVYLSTDQVQALRAASQRAPDFVVATITALRDHTGTAGDNPLHIPAGVPYAVAEAEPLEWRCAARRAGGDGGGGGGGVGPHALPVPATEDLALAFAEHTVDILLAHEHSDV